MATIRDAWVVHTQREVSMVASGDRMALPCPGCGGHGDSVDPPYLDAPCVNLHVRCRDCRQEWHECYRLESIETGEGPISPSYYVRDGALSRGESLEAVARAVVAAWEGGDLADAVRELAEVLGQ